MAKQIAPARLAAKDLPLLRNEMCLWAQLDHPNCVKLLGVSFDPTEFYYLLCEYMPGGSLLDRHNALRSQPTPPRPQTPQMLMEMRQIAEAMDHLHSKNILHRDLKSANVLVAEDGRLVVADFGLVRYCRECSRRTTRLPQPTAPTSGRATDRACLWPADAQGRTSRRT